MSFTANGYTLALTNLTDATNGINKISIFTNIAETAKQDIAFNTPSTTEFGGTVVATSTPHTFTITGGYVVQAIGLYQGTTYVAYIEVANESEPTDYEYVVESITINIAQG